MKKAVSSAIVVVLAIAVIAAIVVFFTSTKASPAKSVNGPADFAKEAMLGLDKGDYQSLFGNIVDETGEKSKYQDTEKSLNAYKELLGSNGENIRIDSVEILRVDKAIDSDLKQALPASTKITEMYKIKSRVIGEAITEKAKGFLGTGTSDVVKADGRWHFFGGRLVGQEIRFETIFEKS